jgi:hypothetical protein
MGLTNYSYCKGIGEATLYNETLKLVIPELQPQDTTTDERIEIALGLEPLSQPATNNPMPSTDTVMNDVQLISVSDLQEVTSVSKNIDPALLEPYIFLSEEQYVYSILCTALVSEIKNQITGSTLTALNLTLLSGYVRYLAAYGAMFHYSSFAGITKVTQKGMIEQTSNDANPTDKLTINRTFLKDQISFFEKKLKEYLDNNKTNYPLYRSCSTTGNNYGNGIYLGPY